MLGRDWMRGKSKLQIAKAVSLALAFGVSASISLEAFARARLSDSLLAAPTRFYARPVVLEPGMVVDWDRLEATLKRLGYERVNGSKVGIGQYRLGTRECTLGRRAFRIYDHLDPGGVVVVRVGYGNRVSEIRDVNGVRIQTLPLDPELIRNVHGSTYEDRVPMSLANAPRHLIDAVIAIEDQRFYRHSGIDPRRVAGAAVANVRARRIAQGASTITQQLAKNLFLSPQRSFTRKLRELALARMLEIRYSKDEILEAYLNEVYLGQDGAMAIHGVGRAAHFFFGKDVSQLTLAESALLAGIIRGPSLYSPFRHPGAAKSRRDLVLDLMLEQGKISETAHRQASGVPIDLRSQPLPARSGRYFIDYAGEQLRTELGKARRSRGLSVFTTLDMGLQQAAEKAIREGLTELERYYPRLKDDDHPLQAALVALDPRTGEILAMVGGRDYGLSQFNRATQAYRQPGSAFKPIVALAAMTRNGRDGADEGQVFTLASVLEDRPLAVETSTGIWEPDNYDGRFRGEVTLREALEGSLNVPFARLGMEIGPANIIETARALGIQNDLNPVLSLALGSSEVSPLELTQAYAVLAAGGYRAELRGVWGVLDDKGGLLAASEPRGEQMFDPAEAYLVTSALRGAVERGTGQSLRTLGFHGPVAAKSGTTNNYRDAWFIGYTPTLAVGVWVGFDDGRRLGITGSRAALPIFGQFLVAAEGTNGEAEFAVPYGIEIAEVNTELGALDGHGCRGETEVFLRGTVPPNSCSYNWRSARRYRSSTGPGWSIRVAPVLRELERRVGRGTN